MIDHMTLVAIRFGHGLPLPDGAPTSPQEMLKALSKPDEAARRFPAATLKEALPQRVAVLQGLKIRRKTN